MEIWESLKELGVEKALLGEALILVTSVDLNPLSLPSLLAEFFTEFFRLFPSRLFWYSFRAKRNPLDDARNLSKS